MPAKLARSQRTASAGSGGGAGAAFHVGDVLGSKYRVERVLGEGGMGVVVAAHHELLDQRVAVKLLYQDVADREAQSRLLLEARATAKLQSEHVARVLDVDVGKDGLPFIVMELLEGSDLCHIADSRGALPPWLVADYLLQALEGLAHAHARGIIHRDLKPSNLFLANRPDGTQVIKILDFGISKTSDGSGRWTQQLTGGRSVLGSPPYMSPEQVRTPKKIDHRSDIWSLGICMYELLTNSMPFGGDEVQETFAHILEKQPTAPCAVVAGIPEGLERVVLRCLAKDREERFLDIGELAAALVPYGSGEWAGAPERIRATLLRGAREDHTSTPRIQASSGRIPLALPPQRRSDPVQAELHGTVRTVAKRGDSRLWMVVLAVPALLALAFVGVTVARRNAYVRRPAPPAVEAAPPPVAEAPVVAPAVAPGVVPAVATVAAVPAVAVEPPPEHDAVPSISVNELSAAPSSSVRAGSKVPPSTPPRPAARPSPRPAPALPVGLPQTRQ